MSRSFAIRYSEGAHRQFFYDVPDHLMSDPKSGDYLVTRKKSGNWGSAYLILRCRRVKQKRPDPQQRRYSLDVQRQPAVTADVLRAARWYMSWRMKHKTVQLPILL